MRLAFICPEMLPLPAIRGGGTEALIDGVTPIIAKKHELTVLSVTDPALPVREVFQGAKYVRFPGKYYWSSIVNYLRRQPPFDVVHVFNRPRRVYAYKQASPASRFVLSLHNEVFSPQLLSDADGLNCIKSVETIMTVSDYIGSTVSRRFPMAAGKLKTVYSGVDLNRYRPVWGAGEKRAALRAKFGLTDKKVIFFVGRLKPKKGPHLLIEALKQVLPKHPDAMLVIVGSRWFSDNTVDDYVRKLYNLSNPVKDKIIFTNYVPQDDMPDYFVMGDVFVCPSQWQEPLARVHYEAMAAGVPVITTNRGGNAEVIKHLHNGLLVNDYKNPSAFARAIDTLLSNPGLAGLLARNGRDMAEKRFSFARVAEELQQVYTGAR
ncbi:MAG: glycosyltransferase family 4 protein [Bacillota bacterium]